MTSTILTLAEPLAPEQVAAYLQANPHFFVAHPELLAELSLPHASGAAVSLIERQVALLRERNRDMRQRMSKLLDNARDNDNLFERSKRLVLTLLEGQDLGDIVDALHYSFDKDFNIQHTRLFLFGNIERVPSSQAQVVSFARAQEAMGLFLKNPRAECGTFEPEVMHFIFGKQAEEIGSVALVPLIQGKVFGLLAIGNRDRNLYRSSMGTLFLSYIAEVLNRLLPHYLPR
jgi:uncharacterized protein YigA (DUF484 family)